MSMMAPADYRQADSKDAASVSRPTPTSSGFLTPGAIAFDGRRDSIASSQSSMSYCHSFASSDYSIRTDYSMPVTPTSEHSPTVDTSFVDMMALDAGTEFNRSFDGLPFTPQIKELNFPENLGEQWTTIPQSTDSVHQHGLPFRTHDGLPAAGDFSSTVHAMVGQDSMQQQVLSATTESCWSGISMAWPDPTMEYHHRPTPGFDLMGGLPVSWNMGSSHALHVPQSMPMGTIIPSHAMLQNSDEYVHVTSDDLGVHMHPELDDDTSYPQSPQEVRFKREESPEIKEEIVVNRWDAERSRIQIYESPTGGKAHKRERVSGRVSKKRSRPIKHEREERELHGTTIHVRLENCTQDKDTGKIISTARPSIEKHRCQIEQNGIRCRKTFRRPEHLKRHWKTHGNERDFRCKLCDKRFGRNDNCSEHLFTHVAVPGKKTGRNNKFPLAEVEEYCTDQRGVEKLRAKYTKALAEMANGTEASSVQEL